MHTRVSGDLKSSWLIRFVVEDVIVALKDVLHLALFCISHRGL
jgi:hypothetical protein